MSYYLRIYDNFHYMEEEEAVNHGEYKTAQEALIEAKKIVNDFIQQALKSGTPVDQLMSSYIEFGEDPVVRSTDKKDVPFFSARDYAESIVNDLKKNAFK
jgi:hypothetical protein